MLLATPGAAGIFDKQALSDPQDPGPLAEGPGHLSIGQLEFHGCNISPGLVPAPTGRRHLSSLATQLARRQEDRGGGDGET